MSKKISQEQLDFNIRLIELVRLEKCLYDKTHENYRCAKYKDEVWESIAFDLNLPGNGKEAKKQFKHLRDYYFARKKKGKSGSDNETPWQFYAHLTWLDSTIECNNTKQPGPSERAVSMKDEDELYCMSLAQTMKTLTVQQRALIKLKIQQVLYEVQTGCKVPTSSEVPTISSALKNLSHPNMSS